MIIASIPTTLTLIAVILLFQTGCEQLTNTLLNKPGRYDPYDCVRIGNDWNVHVKLPVARASSPKNVRLIKDVKSIASDWCNADWVKPFLVKNESPVLMGSPLGIVGDPASVGMTVEGDICSRSPKFIIYDVPYKGIGGRHGYLLWIYGRKGQVDLAAIRIAAALAVTKERCGAAPDDMRFVARALQTVPESVKFDVRAGKVTSFPFTYTEFFRGRVIPGDDIRLVSDDPESAEKYLRSDERRAAEVERARQQVEEEKPLRQAIGTLLGMLLLFAGNDCLDKWTCD
nr:glycosyltransferase [Nitrosomonas nitrosa]